SDYQAGDPASATVTIAEDGTITGFVPGNLTGDVTSLLQAGNAQRTQTVNTHQCSCPTSPAPTATLKYNSYLAAATTLVQVLIPTDPQGTLPPQLQAQLTWDGVAGAAQSFNTPTPDASG